MHIITRKRLNEFAEKHPDTKSGLQHWYELMKTKDFTSFADLRSVFPSADHVGKLTVFNIGGNKYRLIVAINYKTQIVYVHYVLTHKDYDSDGWKEK